MDTASSSCHIPWVFIGVLGGLIFYSRFYVQWIVSEIQGKSVVPVFFWYLSGLGSLLLLSYAVAVQSPLGALSHCFNVVVYGRNLVHIWRKAGLLSKRLDWLFHRIVALGGIVAVGSAATVWIREYHISCDATFTTGYWTWFWLGLGLLGQVLFAGRFLIQWIATEKRHESYVPPVFWNLSLAAAILQTACFVERKEWIFAVGLAATVLIYSRNIMLLRLEKTKWKST
jgi:lipid-A-disaccharide synthase-like uncharacterized protein